MIDFYYWPTPNARKISILFEELNLKYNLIKIDINKGDQFGEKFLEISPNNEIFSDSDKLLPPSRPKI